RSRAFAQAVLTDASKAQLKSGPFAPRELPRFFATTSRSDFRPQPRASYGFLVRVAESCSLGAAPDLPGTLTNLSTRVLPNHPGRPDQVEPLVVTLVGG